MKQAREPAGAPVVTRAGSGACPYSKFVPVILPLVRGHIYAHLQFLRMIYLQLTDTSSDHSLVLFPFQLQFPSESFRRHSSCGNCSAQSAVMEKDFGTFRHGF